MVLFDTAGLGTGAFTHVPMHMYGVRTYCVRIVCRMRSWDLRVVFPVWHDVVSPGGCPGYRLTFTFRYVPFVAAFRLCAFFLVCTTVGRSLSGSSGAGWRLKPRKSRNRFAGSPFEVPFGSLGRKHVQNRITLLRFTASLMSLLAVVAVAMTNTSSETCRATAI